ncbi:cutinase [Mycolicibacterium agri]|uniref:Cutinase n=1 Tax=Mycolicibacterium agri TaxID=36811 RepID=A0A7I9W3T9_MYCAG|nr:cutinase [Mycolicibacterium agri]
MRALLAGAAAAVAAAFGAPTLPVASAEPCPDIAVAFARATGEFPGVGGVGQAFVDALRMQAGGRTVGVHGVIYPASNNFGGGPAFTQNVVDGVRDEANHVQAVLSACPNTKMVLGGYSQGAIVTAFVTSDGMPAEMPAADSVPVPLPPEIADRVAAVVLFGKPTGGALVKYGVPAADVGSRFVGKTLELCAPGDMVCSGDPAGWNSMAHMSYTGNGMIAQAASFALSRL